uniref:RNA helicase n=1 Tax=Parastrongyloides trichosuri TaxID=131310 RepID=A0A0N4ZT97_PARTI
MVNFSDNSLSLEDNKENSCLNFSPSDTCIQEFKSMKCAYQSEQNIKGSPWVLEIIDVWLFKERAADMLTKLTSLIEKINLRFSIQFKCNEGYYETSATLVISKFNYNYTGIGKGFSKNEAINDCAWNIIINLKKFCLESNINTKLSMYIKQLTVKNFGVSNEYFIFQPQKEEINIGGFIISLNNSKQQLKRILDSKYSSLEIIFSKHIYINQTRFFFVKRGAKLRGINFFGYGLGETLEGAEDEACYNIFFSYGEKQYTDDILSDKGKKYMLKENFCTIKVDSDVEKDLENFIEKFNVKTAFIPKTVNSRINLMPNVKPNVSIAQNSRRKYKMDEWIGPTKNYCCWSDSQLHENHKYFNKDLNEISRMLLEEERNKIINDDLENRRCVLPICMEKSKLLKIVEENQLIIIKSNTGSGKSTQIPQILLKSYIENLRGAEFNCVVTQPRRLCAVSLANQVAMERYEEVGNSVGYSVRFERCNPRPFGSIFYTTVGTLLRSISFGLKGITHIVVDEVHERTISIDFLLIILKMMLEKNSSIKIILMSATINTKQFENYFKNNAYVYELSVPVFETKLLFLEDIIQELCYCPYGYEKVCDENGEILTFESFKENSSVSKKAEFIATDIEINDEIPYNLIVDILKKVIQEHSCSDGSILVFLPGWQEISTLKNIITSVENTEVFMNTIVIPLHSSLPINEQNGTIINEIGGKFKIIISTNIAESSITIPNVICVIDSGKLRANNFKNTNSMSILDTIWTSQDCMEQRAGRAGRTRSGYCYRLCTKSLFNNLPKKQKPGMHRESLHSIILSIKSLELGDPYNFLNLAIEPPSQESIKDAEKYLIELSALDSEKNLTALGLQMVNFSFEPAYTKSLLVSILLNVPEEMALIMGYDNLHVPFFNKKVGKGYILQTIQEQFLVKHSLLSDHYMAWNFHNLVFEENLSIEEYERRCSNYCISTSASNLLFKTNNQITGKIRKDFSICNNNRKGNLCSSYKEFVLSSLLLKAHYPNVGYIFQEGVSEITNLCLNDFEGKKIKIQKDSCLYFNTQNNSNRTIKTNSPFYVYAKTRKNGKSIIGNNLTNVKPIQLLLFGCRNAYTDKDIGVELDQNICINMNRKIASQILGLRVVIDNMVDSLCLRGYLNAKEEEMRLEILKIISKLSVI